MARTKGAEGRKYRNRDHQACIKIARLRLAEPSLSIWQAIFRVGGDGGGWRHQGAEQRRLHGKYEVKEAYYVALVQAETRAQKRQIVRPTPQLPALSRSIAAIAKQMEQTWRPVIKAQEDYDRLVKSLNATLGNLPNLL